MDKNLHQHIFKTSTCLGREEVDAYLRGQLAGADRRRVENHLLDCPLCSDAVDGFQDAAVPGAGQLEDFSAFKKKLEQPSGGVIRKLEPYRLLKRAVSLAALFAVGLFAYLSFFQSPDGSKLYDEFYTTYENDIPLNLRSTDSAQLMIPALQKALQQYSTGQFSASIPNFEEALKLDPDNASAHFFAGLAYLETGQPELAISHFKKVAAQGGSYSQKAEWYLILAHLKTGEKDTAKTLLEDYAKHGAFKVSEAAALLDKL